MSNDDSNNYYNFEVHEHKYFQKYAITCDMIISYLWKKSQVLLIPPLFCLPAFIMEEKCQVSVRGQWKSKHIFSIQIHMLPKFFPQSLG